MMITSLAVSALVAGASAAETSTPSNSNVGGGSIVRSLFQNGNELLDQQETWRRQQEATPTFLQYGSGQRRRAEEESEDEQAMCDEAFLQCLPNEDCVNCFIAMQSEGIDWASVTKNTPCSAVVDILTRAGKCYSLKNNQQATGVFCDTFDACVVFEDEMDDETSEDYVNCSELEECNWPGYHPSFIGDGVCHDNMHGCYNTEICNWDGGDCCEDKCVGKSDYVECGHDGFACRDPNSEKCDPTLTTKCPNAANSGNDPDEIQCNYGESKYRLIMYDSFGDGWDTTKLKITDDTNKVVFEDGLAMGSQETRYICLATSAKCYDAVTSGGVWGIEVSWEVKPMSNGFPAIAGGGAPMDCNFAVGGASCPNTCTGRPNVDPTTDPDYKDFKDMYNCIEDKCIIQLQHCESSPVCKQCFEEDAPDSCFTIDEFNALVDCTICSCTDRSVSSYCQTKLNPGITPVDPVDESDDYLRPCSPAETIQGSNAVISFSQCTEFDQVAMMVTEFDNNNFGQLDTFETCAHSFKNEPYHGGRSALECMRILKSAITNPVVDDNSDAPLDAIAALANFLYNDAHSFCDCAADASKECPLCPSFMQFKTLLYESLDACHALDEIDCDAWVEYSGPCKRTMTTIFGTINFAQEEQCDFVKNGCDGTGPFPAFRQMDCGKEIPEDNFNFYVDYKSGCLQGDNGIAPSLSPVTAPSAAPQSSPTTKPYVPPDSPGNSPTPKPYVPPDSDGSNSDFEPESPKTSKKSKKKKSHVFRNFFILCFLAGCGYVYYKRRNNTFNFSSYQPARTYDQDGGMGGSEMMYGNLNSSTSFEPPSLPPPPTAMGPNNQPLM